MGVNQSRIDPCRSVSCNIDERRLGVDYYHPGPVLDADIFSANAPDDNPVPITASRISRSASDVRALNTMRTVFTILRDEHVLVYVQTRDISAANETSFARNLWTRWDDAPITQDEYVRAFDESARYEFNILARWIRPSISLSVRANRVKFPAIRRAYQVVICNYACPTMATPRGLVKIVAFLPLDKQFTHLMRAPECLIDCFSSLDAPEDQESEDFPIPEKAWRIIIIAGYERAPFPMQSWDMSSVAARKKNRATSAECGCRARCRRRVSGVFPRYHRSAQRSHIFHRLPRIILRAVGFRSPHSLFFNLFRGQIDRK